jgi:hypothetical protein
VVAAVVVATVEVAAVSAGPLGNLRIVGLMEHWSNGVMDYWINGLMDDWITGELKTPSFHHSNTPVLQQSINPMIQRSITLMASPHHRLISDSERMT